MNDYESTVELTSIYDSIKVDMPLEMINTLKAGNVTDSDKRRILGWWMNEKGHIATTCDIAGNVIKPNQFIPISIPWDAYTIFWGRMIKEVLN